MTAETMPAAAHGVGSVMQLDVREGLPDGIAFLRSTYPRSDWRRHRNFGSLAKFWLDVHASLRGEGRRVGALIGSFREGSLDAVGFQRSFVPRLNSFLAGLDGHHQVEDAHYFPKFRALDDRLVQGFDLLEVDHEVMHEALLTSVQSGRVLVTALGNGLEAARGPADAHAAVSERLLALLTRHLDDEEDLILPSLLHYGERPLS